MLPLLKVQTSEPEISHHQLLNILCPSIIKIETFKKDMKYLMSIDTNTHLNNCDLAVIHKCVNVHRHHSTNEKKW